MQDYRNPYGQLFHQKLCEEINYRSEETRYFVRILMKIEYGNVGDAGHFEADKREN